MDDSLFNLCARANNCFHFDKQLGCFGQIINVFVVNLSSRWGTVLNWNLHFDKLFVIYQHVNLEVCFNSCCLSSFLEHHLENSVVTLKMYLNKSVFLFKNILENTFFNKFESFTNLYFFRRGPRPFGLARHTHEQVFHKFECISNVFHILNV